MKVIITMLKKIQERLNPFILSLGLLFLSNSLLFAHIDIQDKIYRGKYIWGNEVHSFMPCNFNNDLAYWVSGDFPIIEMLNFYKKNFKKAYQPLYVEFRGHFLNEEVDGFATDYDGVIRISEVYFFSFDIPSTCQN